MADNKFITDDGVEFMLHELEPTSSQYDSGSSSRASFKKRGRPRKDEIRENNENCLNSISKLTEEKLRKRRDKKECKELERIKRREELRKSVDSTPKKRGRPRKFNIIDTENSSVDYHVSSNSDTLTPPYSEISEESSEVGESSIMELLTLDQDLFPADLEQQSHEHTEITDSNYNWSPVQRLMQLNQALAFTTMYRDLIYWDRLIAEFLQPSITFRLEFGSEKSFDVPFLVVSKLFWMYSHIGLHRIHLLHTGITEKLAQMDGVLFNSSDAFIYAHMYNDERLMVQHRTSQLIEFDGKSKISKWTIRFLRFEEFWKRGGKSDTEEFLWGFPKRVFDFLEVALVMNSVLPDPSSWLTWFYTYIQQNCLKNFSVVELSRPPSPFQFPALTDEVMTDLQCGDLGNMEFFDKGRDFIFNVLQSGVNESVAFDASSVQFMQPLHDNNMNSTPLNEEQTLVTPLAELFGNGNEMYPQFNEYQAETENIEVFQCDEKVLVELKEDEFIEEFVQSEPPSENQSKDNFVSESEVLHEKLSAAMIISESNVKHENSFEEPIVMESTQPEFVDQVFVEISDSEPAAVEEDDFFDSYC